MLLLFQGSKSHISLKQLAYAILASKDKQQRNMNKVCLFCTNTGAVLLCNFVFYHCISKKELEKIKYLQMLNSVFKVLTWELGITNSKVKWREFPVLLEAQRLQDELMYETLRHQTFIKNKEFLTGYTCLIKLSVSLK